MIVNILKRLPMVAINSLREINNGVLLATTAIAAMGVTAAQADISISGNYSGNIPQMTPVQCGAMMVTLTLQQQM